MHVFLGAVNHYQHMWPQIFWINYIEQFNPYIHFIPGKDNIIADTLSWLDCLEEFFISKTNKYFFSKTLSLKGWTLLMTNFSSNAFSIFHHWKYKILTQTIVKGSLQKNETDKLVKCHQKFPDRYFNKILDD